MLGSSYFYLGYRSNRFSECVMDEKVSGLELVERHSIFPLISEFFSPHVARKWQMALINGDRAVHQRFRATVPLQDFVSVHCRLCPHCVEEDLRTHSIAFWRVAHQVSLVDLCAAHNTPLRVQASSQFGQPTRFGEEKSLPHDHLFRHRPFKLLTSPSTQPLSRFEPSAVQRVIERALNRQAPELRPEIRNATFSWHKGKNSRSGDALEAAFRIWCEREQVFQLIGTSPPELRKFFEHGATNNILLLLVASIFLWAQLPSDEQQIISRAAARNPMYSPADENTGSTHLLLERELNELVDQLHLPEKLVDSILDGEGYYKFAGSLDFLNLEQSLSVQSRKYLKAMMRSVLD